MIIANSFDEEELLEFFSIEGIELDSDLKIGEMGWADALLELLEGGVVVHLKGGGWMSMNRHRRAVFIHLK